MKNTIHDVFNKYFSKLKIDNALIKRLTKFRDGWKFKTQDHMEFLGGNLIGVNVLKFSELDEDKFFNNVLGVDKKRLRTELHSLEDIYPERKVSSNVTYLTIIYLAYLFDKSIKNDKEYNKVAELLYEIFAYKAISSLYSNYFSYPLNNNTAILVYEKLTKNFLIKRLDTWEDVIKYRADAIKRPDGLHIDKFKDLTGEEAGKIVADLQGRLRDMVKNIYPIILEVKESETNLLTTSLTSTEEGEEVIMDIMNNDSLLITNIKTIMINENDFIKIDLVNVVLDLFNKINDKVFKNILVEFSKESLDPKFQANGLLDELILVSLDYLNRKDLKYTSDRDLENILFTLKNFWSSSSTNIKVKEIKKSVELVVKKVYKNKTQWLLSSLVISVIIYIFLRAIIKRR